MTRRPSSSEQGRRGEEIALDFLLKKEYTLLRRNYRTPQGEIDIIVMDRGTVVFVEVKMSNRYEVADIGYSVDRRKQARLRGAALVYLRDFCDTVERPARFDVILVNIANETVVHFQNAF